MNIPLDNLEGIKTKEEIDKLNESKIWLSQYNLFMKAKNLGIKFGPKDITFRQLEMFDTIKETIDKQEQKNKPGNK